MGDIVRHPGFRSGPIDHSEDLAELRLRAGLADDLERHAALLRRESRWPIPFSVYLAWESGEAALPGPVRGAAERLVAQATGEQEDDVDRRDFLKLGAAVVGAAMRDPESLTSMLAGLHPFDAAGLDDLAVEVDELQRQFEIAQPDDLLRRTRWHISTATSAEVRTPALARRLASMTGEMAVLAGRLSFRLHNTGLAEDYFSLASRMASEAGDSSLAGLALASRSTIFSNVDYDSRGGDRPRTAVQLLDAAVSGVSAQAPPHLRAWILWHRAEEFAALGEEMAADRDLEAGLDAIEVATSQGTGLFATLSAGSFPGYRGCCAVALNRHAGAISILEGACSAAAGSPWRSCTARIDLAAAHARHAEIERACDLLHEALTMAAPSRLREIVRRVRRVHQQELVGRSEAGYVRQLDEQLRLVEVGR